MICTRCYATVQGQGLCPHCGGETSSAVLQLERDKGVISHFFLTTKSYVLGRSMENEIGIDDPSVSKVHARIVCLSRSCFEVEDLNSRNGIFVNDRKVKNHRLESGDRIQLGETILRYITLIDPLTTRESARRSDFQNLLLNMLQVINSSLMLDQVLAQVLDAVLKITEAERGCLLLVDNHDGLVLGAGFDQAHFTMVVSRPETLTIEQLSSTAINHVLVSGRGMATTHATTDPAFSPSESIVSLDLRTIVCAPLISEHSPDGHSQIIGIIYVDNQSIREPFSQECLETVEALGTHASLAITNARHYEAKMRALEDLRQAQRQLVQAEKLTTIGQMAAGIVHELKNPLTCIAGNLELLRLGLGKDDPEPLYDGIERGNHRIERLVGDLLNFVRSGTGRAEEINLQDTIQRSIRLCRYQMNRAKVEARVTVAEPCPVVMGVSSQLELVFTNLIVNAVQAMEPQGGGIIAFDTREGEEGAEVQVSDTGPGMPKTILDRMFDPFFTASKSESTGTGLGLPTVLMVVQQHGGRIGVNSQLGQGTTFQIFLPKRGA